MKNNIKYAVIGLIALIAIPSLLASVLAGIGFVSHSLIVQCAGACWPLPRPNPFIDNSGFFNFVFDGIGVLLAAVIVLVIIVAVIGSLIKIGKTIMPVISKLQERK